MGMPPYVTRNFAKIPKNCREDMIALGAWTFWEEEMPEPRG